METYELVVIGSGPAGEKAAVKAAFYGHRVALVEKEATLGGAAVLTGTLPSKTLKETAVYFSGKYDTGLYGVDRHLRHETSIEDFMYRKNYVTASEAEAVQENLRRHGVDIYHGVASFEDTHTIRVSGPQECLLRADYIIIASGSYPHHPANIPFDGKRVHDSDTILELRRFPASLCIVGAGVIGCEYTTIFSTMGIKVYLVNDKDRILPFVDLDISRELIAQMKRSGVDIVFNTGVESLQVPQQETEPLRVYLKNGETVEADMFLFAAGRSGNIKALQCDRIGLKTGSRGTIEVNERYCTSTENIYAVGDVIGFPSLASTGMDQARVAIAHIFQTRDLAHLPTHLPYGIYTVPEVSMVGISEEEAVRTSLSYGLGKARYADTARGKIMGAEEGFLKLVFNWEDLVIRGIHIIGNIASEIIHYGIELVEEKKTLYDVIGRVFNYPSLHDLYKLAAYDGLANRFINEAQFQQLALSFKKLKDTEVLR